MTIFRDQKVLRRLRRMNRGLVSIAATGDIDTDLCKRMMIVANDLEGLIERVDRCPDFFTKSGSMLRANVVKALLEVVGIKVFRTIIGNRVAKQFRGLYEAAITMINEIMIDDPEVMSPGDMSDEWSKTRRGNFYRKHVSGVELLVEVFPGDRCVGSVSEVAVLNGLSEQEALAALDTFADGLFAPVIQKQKELQLFQSMFTQDLL